MQSAQIKAEQPIYKLTLTKAAATTYTYLLPDEACRLLPFRHTESPYSHRATALLDNGDGALTSIDFRGYTAVLSYGAVTTTGNEYSATAPLLCTAQQLVDNWGRLTCELTLIGIPDLMDMDEASESYVPEKTDPKTVKTILRQIAGDTGETILTCFSHCTLYNVSFDSEDSLIDTYRPGNSFRIMEGGSRLEAWRRALRVTGCVSRIQNDGKIHVFAPTVSGTSYDASYSLSAGAHVFFSKAYRSRIPDPAYVSVKNIIGETEYSGYAEDTDVAAADRRRRFYREKVISTAQANAIAAAILQNAQLDAEQGSGSVPMDCGAEVYDYVNIVDSHEGDDRTGNIGQLQRYFAPRTFNMDFQFGGVEARMPLPIAGTPTPQTPSSKTTSPDYSSNFTSLYKAINDLYDNQQQIIDNMNKIIDYAGREDMVLNTLHVKERLIIPVRRPDGSAL